MKMRIQVIIESDEGVSEVLTEVASLQRNGLGQAELGLRLTEAKELLIGLQKVMVDAQIDEYIQQQRVCSDCNKSRKQKGKHKITFHSVFGKMKLNSPRFYSCACQTNQTNSKQSFSPLALALPEHTSPELLYLESKWAALMPYGVTVELLKEVLPIGTQLNTTSVRRHLHKLAERSEKELKDKKDQPYFSRQEVKDVKPAQPLAIGIDGGYIHARNQKGRREGWFEVIVGKSIGEDRATKSFGYVQLYDNNPVKRVYELLQSQGLERGQPIIFLTDGGETVRTLPHDIYPQAEHILDWFHITMRLTVINQMVKGLSKQSAQEVISNQEKQVERVKWYLWHGNVYRALQVLHELEFVIECPENSAESSKLLKAVEEFDTYITGNQALITNYGDRYRYGERISTGFVESTVNQIISKRFVKKQQMRWTKRGAHLLLG